MLNVLIISDEAKNIYALFKSSNLDLHAEDSHMKSNALKNDSVDLHRYDIAFLDLEIEGWQQKLLELRQQMPVVTFSSPNTRMAVDAMKLGAADYLEKPLTSDAFNDVMGRYKKKILEHKYGFDEILGTSTPMQEVFGLIKKAAVGGSNVLITGESGTGKELVARAIHRWSPRSEKSFMTINCSAIPDTLLESELFGFEKGSFTGAVYTKKGILELTDGGTVFFDEIGDVSPLFQTKILRVLQEGEVMRIGGMHYINVDVRIIAATNKDLRIGISKGSFREDLFYRLNVINIHIPPLRERTEDIQILVKHFIKKHASKRKDLLIKGVTSDAMNILRNYPYPGNVRELENIIERAISLSNSPEILSSDLPSFIMDGNLQRKKIIPKLKDAISSAEKETIIAALNETDWNISRAALLLGIYRQQLQKKIKDQKIKPQ